MAIQYFENSILEYFSTENKIFYGFCLSNFGIFMFALLGFIEAIHFYTKEKYFFLGCFAMLSKTSLTLSFLIFNMLLNNYIWTIIGAFSHFMNYFTTIACFEDRFKTKGIIFVVIYEICHIIVQCMLNDISLCENCGNFGVFLFILTEYTSICVSIYDWKNYYPTPHLVLLLSTIMNTGFYLASNGLRSKNVNFLCTFDLLNVLICIILEIYSIVERKLKDKWKHPHLE